MRRLVSVVGFLAVAAACKTTGTPGGSQTLDTGPGSVEVGRTWWTEIQTNLGLAQGQADTITATAGGVKQAIDQYQIAASLRGANAQQVADMQKTQLAKVQELTASTIPVINSTIDILAKLDAALQEGARATVSQADRDRNAAAMAANPGASQYAEGAGANQIRNVPKCLQGTYNNAPANYGFGDDPTCQFGRDGVYELLGQTRDHFINKLKKQADDLSLTNARPESIADKDNRYVAFVNDILAGKNMLAEIQRRVATWWRYPTRLGCILAITDANGTPVPAAQVGTPLQLRIVTNADPNTQREYPPQRMEWWASAPVVGIQPGTRTPFNLPHTIGIDPPVGTTAFAAEIHNEAGFTACTASVTMTAVPPPPPPPDPTPQPPPQPQEAWCAGGPQMPNQGFNTKQEARQCARMIANEPGRGCREAARYGRCQRERMQPRQYPAYGPATIWVLSFDGDVRTYPGMRGEQARYVGPCKCENDPERILKWQRYGNRAGAPDWAGQHVHPSQEMN